MFDGAWVRYRCAARVGTAQGLWAAYTMCAPNPALAQTQFPRASAYGMLFDLLGFPFWLPVVSNTGFLKRYGAGTQLTTLALYVQDCPNKPCYLCKKSGASLLFYLPASL